MAREVKDWITINGQHIPIYEGESKQDAYNRSVAKQNEDKKASDIAKNKEQADAKNKEQVNKSKDKKDDFDYEPDDSVKRDLAKRGIPLETYKKEYIPLVKNWHRLQDMYYDIDEKKNPERKREVEAAMDRAEAKMNSWIKKQTQSNKDKTPVKSEYEKYMTKYHVIEPVGSGTTYRVKSTTSDGKVEYKEFRTGESARNYAQEKQKIAKRWLLMNGIDRMIIRKINEIII